MENETVSRRERVARGGARRRESEYIGKTASLLRTCEAVLETALDATVRCHEVLV